MGPNDQPRDISRGFGKWNLTTKDVGCGSYDQILEYGELERRQENQRERERLVKLLDGFRTNVMQFLDANSSIPDKGGRKGVDLAVVLQLNNVFRASDILLLLFGSCLGAA